MRQLPKVDLTMRQIRELTKMLFICGYSDYEIYEALEGDAPISDIRGVIISIQRDGV
jgi:hypothetical protein